ncbi:MAG: phosphatidate cytidylyltransferase [Chthoniobacteraceae bacterium]|nr:phosphatidate cytidylyltransferase [Chthoniobacteraceae bacterium]
MTPVFLSRLLSTLVLWTVVLWTIFCGYEVGFFVMLSAVGLAGLWEFYRMLDHKGLPNFKIVGMLCGGVLLGGSFYYYNSVGPSRSYDWEMISLLGFLFTVFTRQIFKGLRDADPLPTMAFTLFGLLYVIWMFNFMNKIVYILPRGADQHATGQFYVLYLIVVTKFSDMGAYITGSLVGRHKMVPQISPKKTWEGFAGALAFSLLGSYGMFWLMPKHLSRLDWTHATILGLLLGFAAIVGDLAESILKRGTGTKDSGRFLPGIGGALDLIDSLLFTAPLLFFYLRAVIRVG